MKEKTLPNNIEAEKSLLGSMFWSLNALQKGCEELDKDVFYLDSNSKIFEIIKYLYDNKKPVDISSVTTELINRNYLTSIGGVPYLNEIIDSVATGANIDYYISIVLERYTLRNLIEVTTDIISNSYKDNIHVYDLLESAEKKILNVSKNRRTSEFRSIQDVLSKAQDDLETLAKNKGNITGITSGLWDLDNLTSGFHPNQLIIIAARPAVGKSALALNMAINAAKSTKKNIAIFSLEMPAEQLVSRMISSVGQINGKKLMSGKLENEDWRRVTEAISQLSDTNIYFDDSGGITSGEIKAKCRRLSTIGEGLGLVIIDYLQLISGSSRISSANRQQEVSEISRNLKLMAMELGVPVIALSQLSRNVEKREDKKPVLSDLRESGSIEQDADIVAAIHNPNADKETPDTETPVPVQLIILKHRNGPTKDINLLFKKNTSTFLSFKKEDENDAK